ncbi:MAG: bifunctional diguanylate cyclase/phosphodiesterase [Actinomycetales bacterium]|nr:bifunctional diguanylate cyclase/phosphodiesterase [Actinomycetales bacterium]
MSAGGGAPRRRPRSRRGERTGPLHPAWALPLYAYGVGVLGVVAAAVVVVVSPPWSEGGAPVLQLGVLAAFLVVGELTSVPVMRGDRAAEPVTTSTTFAVALLALGPLSLLLLVHTLAVALDDLRARRRPIQVVFNAGQYAVSILAGRAVFSLISGVGFLGGVPAFDAGLLLATLAAGLTFAIVNDALVSAVAGLATGQPITAMLFDDLLFKLETYGVLVALGPVAALVVGTSVLMLPLLLLPVLAVRRTAQVAALREHQSLHDPLTGLANRTLFRRRLERAIDSHGARGLAVLMIDLDHFKDVNDTLGHDVGDDLLREIARRLEAAAAQREEQVEVARLGGDEFALLAVADHPRLFALDLASEILGDLARPIESGPTRLSIQASVGITTSEGTPLLDVRTTLRQADIALYEAKHERARAVVFHPAALTESVDRLRLLPDLREALDDDQIRTAFQPQVDAVTGRVVAVEALARWEHPAQGSLLPETFIGVAESCGLISALTVSVLRRSLEAVAAWRCAGHDVGVAVNLSARLLSDLALPERIARLLAETGVPAEALTVEVTENSLMSDVRAARTILRGLRDMGVRLSIDDFGTGYSSLLLLQQLDVDELKIDKSFVEDLTPGSHGEYLARSIIELGHNLGLCVVAEGVESAATAARLRELGCDRLQGFLYAPPVDRGEADQLVGTLLRDGQRAATVDELIPAEPRPRVAV